LRWGQKSDRRVVATMMAESVILDLRPHLSNILFPVTIVVPTESDSKDSKEKALVLNKKLYSNLQGAGLNLAIVPHSGHFVMIDQPARLDVILDKFVGLAP
jgi:pimeloyl-[acyl-carrier protein] methyl ester esterase